MGEFLRGLEEIELRGLAVQTDSIRKLIVSEVNMFKNIEYDLLNISRQMEAVSPQSQIECFVVSNKDTFRNPIISIYAEGPVANRYSPVHQDTSSLTPSSPSSARCSRRRCCASTAAFSPGSSKTRFLLLTQNNSTLRYTVERLLKRYEEKEAGDNDFLEEFESCIGSNRTVRDMPLDGTEGKEAFLNAEEVYSLCIEIVAGIAQFMRAE